MKLRNPIGVLIERDARRVSGDPRWQWRKGAMEHWDGFDLYFYPFMSAVRHWRQHSWDLW